MKIKNLLKYFNEIEGDEREILVAIYDEYDDREVVVPLEDVISMGTMQDHSRALYDNCLLLWGTIRREEEDDDDDNR